MMHDGVLDVEKRTIGDDRVHFGKLARGKERRHSPHRHAVE